MCSEKYCYLCVETDSSIYNRKHLVDLNVESMALALALRVMSLLTLLTILIMSADDRNQVTKGFTTCCHTR